jgi:hypothetical protein
MKLFKAVILCSALVSAVAVTANAADPGSTTAVPPQVATNPGIPYSSGRLPGPKASPNGWIPSPYAAAPGSGASPNSGDTGYYSGKGFGPKLN